MLKHVKDVLQLLCEDGMDVVCEHSSHLIG